MNKLVERAYRKLKGGRVGSSHKAGVSKSANKAAKQLALAFANGINKINIGTEFFNLNTKLNQEFYAQDFTKCDPFGFPEYIQPKLTEYIAGRLELSKITL